MCDSFWFDGFHKLNEADRNAFKYQFATQWEIFSDKRLLELQEEEVLEMRVRLRQRMGLLVERADEKKFQMISKKAGEQKIVPITSELNFLETNSLPKLKPPKQIDNTNLDMPDVTKDLSDNEIIFLFENLYRLNEKLSNDLFRFLRLIERSDKARYQNLIHIPFANFVLDDESSI